MERDKTRPGKATTSNPNLPASIARAFSFSPHPSLLCRWLSPCLTRISVLLPSSLCLDHDGALIMVFPAMMPKHIVSRTIPVPTLNPRPPETCLNSCRRWLGMLAQRLIGPLLSECGPRGEAAYKHWGIYRACAKVIGVSFTLSAHHANIAEQAALSINILCAFTSRWIATADILPAKALRKE